MRSTSTGKIVIVPPEFQRCVSTRPYAGLIGPPECQTENIKDRVSKCK